MELTLIAGMILLISFIVLLIVGVPISVSIGISGLATIFVVLPFDKATFVAAQCMFTGIDSF